MALNFLFREENPEIKFKAGKYRFTGEALSEIGDVRFAAVGAENPGLLCFGVEQPGEAHPVGDPDRAHFGLQHFESVAGATHFDDEIRDYLGKGLAFLFGELPVFFK